MNAENLHDALTLLPEDLIAEVDALRRAQKQKNSRRKHILPTAACAAIVLLSCLTLPDLLTPRGRTLEDCASAENVQAPAASPPVKQESAQIESPAEKAPGQGDERSMEFDEAVPSPLTARYLPVQPSETGGGQAITVISDRAALDAYLAGTDSGGALKTACAPYDEAYFSANQLVLLLTAQYRPAGSYSGNVLLPLQSGSWSAEKAGDGSWLLRVRDTVPDDSANDVVRQHILLELPGHLIAPTDTIILKQEP